MPAVGLAAMHNERMGSMLKRLAVFRPGAHLARMRRTVCAGTLLIALIVTMAGPARAQAQPRRSGAAVVLDKQTLFYLYARVGSFTAADRAKLVSERLAAIGDRRSLSLANIATLHDGQASDIVIGEMPIAQITDRDASALGIPRERLADRYAERMREALQRYRDERSVPTVIRAALYTLGATLCLVGLLWAFGLAFGAAATKIRSLSGTHVRPLRFHNAEILSTAQVGEAILWVVDAVRIAALFVLFYAYLTLVFSFFPWTEGYAGTLLGYVSGQVRTVGKALVAAIPDLLFVALIVIIARFIIKGIRFCFGQIERGAISFEGFEREWAEPTFKLVRLLVVILAAIAAFPYVPGSKSPAFQGISVFVGIIVSLGSTGAVSNMVAGVVLTYMRPFRVGDRVKVADTTGDIIEKSLLVTRIRTIKNVEVTIPNALVLGAHITNYSANARSDGLVLHTTVTIGYDVPWRQVHDLLINAARKTPNILDKPAPYVLQTSLDDHYVAYEINAYTDQPNRMATIYSMLHQEIQDAFNEAGVEIMSPHYQALRDGNEVTVPAEYRPDGYAAPSFRVEDTTASKGDRA